MCDRNQVCGEKMWVCEYECGDQIQQCFWGYIHQNNVWSTIHLPIWLARSSASKKALLWLRWPTIQGTPKSWCDQIWSADLCVTTWVDKVSVKGCWIATIISVSTKKGHHYTQAEPQFCEYLIRPDGNTQRSLHSSPTHLSYEIGRASCRERV